MSGALVSRTRSSGWKHAKLDGHINEENFADQLKKDSELRSKIELLVLRRVSELDVKVEADGAKYVDSIFEDKTISKTDIKILWRDGNYVNLSVKKSRSGQAWLIAVPRFISGIEYHLNEKLDKEVVTSLSLFIGGSNLEKYMRYFEIALKADRDTSPSIAAQEARQKRLVAQSLKQNFPDLWTSLIGFFSVNIQLITHLTFAQGLAKSKSECAQLIAYNRESTGVDFFYIPDLVHKVVRHIATYPLDCGPRNGGSTIILPTGFLQMHHPQGENQMQFHHNYERLTALNS